MIQSVTLSWPHHKRFFLITVFLIWAAYDNTIGSAAEALMSSHEFLDYDKRLQALVETPHHNEQAVFQTLLSLSLITFPSIFIYFCPGIAVYPLHLLTIFVMARIPESLALEQFIRQFWIYGAKELYSFKSIAFLHTPIVSFLITLVFSLQQLKRLGEEKPTPLFHRLRGIARNPSIISSVANIMDRTDRAKRLRLLIDTTRRPFR